MGEKIEQHLTGNSALSLGAATMVAMAMFVAEAKAQTSGEGLPNLEAPVIRIIPLTCFETSAIAEVR